MLRLLWSADMWSAWKQIYRNGARVKRTVFLPCPFSALLLFPSGTCGIVLELRDGVEHKSFRSSSRTKRLFAGRAIFLHLHGSWCMERCMVFAAAITSVSNRPSPLTNRARLQFELLCCYRDEVVWLVENCGGVRAHPSPNF